MTNRNNDPVLAAFQNAPMRDTPLSEEQLRERELAMEDVLAGRSVDAQAEIELKIRLTKLDERRGAEKERARIVAYIRRQASWVTDVKQKMALSLVADGIEAGEHEK